MKILGRILGVVICLCLHQVFFRLDTSKATSTATRDERSTGSVNQERNVLALLDDYKKAHDVKILEADATNNTRVFVVGTYSCPYQAGNRIFHFLNGFVHAVVLNKTLVWKYCNTNKICPKHGSVEDCDLVLKRADWIPSWQTIVGDVKTELLHDTRRPKRERVLDNNVTKREIPLDQLWNDSSSTKVFLETGIVEGPGLWWLALPEIREKNILSPAAFQRAKTLFSAGSDFAYGALFDAAFQIDPALLPTEETLLKLGLDHYYSTSIALHSRHQNKLDEGNDTSIEEECLQKAYQMTKKRSTSSSFQSPPCAMVLMSDRSATLEGLQQKRPSGCTPVVASHQTGQSFRSEHGEFAGAGFFQDLALAQHAQDAVVLTHHSTASLLIRCVWRYQRFVSNTTGDIVSCTIREPNSTQCNCRSERI